MSDITSYNESWLLNNKDKYVYCKPKEDRCIRLNVDYKHTDLLFLNKEYKYEIVDTNTILSDNINESYCQEYDAFPFLISEINFNNF